MSNTTNTNNQLSQRLETLTRMQYELMEIARDAAIGSEIDREISRICRKIQRVQSQMKKAENTQSKYTTEEAIDYILVNTYEETVDEGSISYELNSYDQGGTYYVKWTANNKAQSRYVKEASVASIRMCIKN